MKKILNILLIILLSISLFTTNTFADTNNDSSTYTINDIGGKYGNYLSNTQKNWLINNFNTWHTENYVLLYNTNRSYLTIIDLSKSNGTNYYRLDISVDGVANWGYYNGYSTWQYRDYTICLYSYYDFNFYDGKTFNSTDSTYTINLPPVIESEVSYPINDFFNMIKLLFETELFKYMMIMVILCGVILLSRKLIRF